jgi:dTMP kinase
MNNMAKGLFISFEGIDGAGKSTHIAALVSEFKRAGRNVTTTREPGGTALAEKLREIILNDAMDPLSEALLIFAARRDHIAQVIWPALQRGDVVVCDRFTDATFAYQGAGRGFDVATLSRLEVLVQQGWGEHPLLQPDMTLWFDLSPCIAAQRLAGARVPDKFESQPEAFFQAVAAGYGLRAQAEPQRFARIDAAQAPAQVWGQVLGAVLARGHLSGAGKGSEPRP